MEKKKVHVPNSHCFSFLLYKMCNEVICVFQKHFLFIIMRIFFIANYFPACNFFFKCQVNNTMEIIKWLILKAQNRIICFGIYVW